MVATRLRRRFARAGLRESEVGLHESAAQLVATRAQVRHEVVRRVLSPMLLPMRVRMLARAADGAGLALDQSGAQPQRVFGSGGVGEVAEAFGLLAPRFV